MTETVFGQLLLQSWPVPPGICSPSPLVRGVASCRLKSDLSVVDRIRLRVQSANYFDLLTSKMIDASLAFQTKNPTSRLKYPLSPSPYTRFGAGSGVSSQCAFGDHFGMRSRERVNVHGALRVGDFSPKATFRRVGARQDNDAEYKERNLK